MTEKKRNLICSLLFFIIGVFLYFEASQIHAIMAKDLGSGFFPKVVAVSMIIIAVVEFIYTFLFSTQQENKKEDAKDQDVKGLLLTILCMAGYGFLLDELGFIISSSLYLFLQMTVLSTQKNRKLPLFAVISILSTVAIYGIFVYLIGMPLPVGILEF